MATPKCPTHTNEPTIVNFLASVHIPVGYAIDTELYSLHLSLDESDLKVDRTTELKSSTIVLDATVAPPITLECMSKVYKFGLHGNIFYNLVIQRFKTASTLNLKGLTAFSANNTIPIDTVLGFACHECELEESTLRTYTVELDQGTEFVVTDIGAVIPYNEVDPSEYFLALSDTRTSQIIQVPYTLTVTPTDTLLVEGDPTPETDYCPI